MEVALLPGRRIGARDSQRGAAGPVLTFSSTDWRSFIAQVKEGTFGG